MLIHWLIYALLFSCWTQVLECPSGIQGAHQVLAYISSCTEIDSREKSEALSYW